MPNLNHDIGKRISSLRKTANLTQEQLSSKLDISVKHCSAVERGISCLSLEKLIDVSELFDVSMDYLIRGKNSASKEEYALIPPSIVEALNSDDEKEKNLLLKYLHLYPSLRRGSLD